MNKRHIQQHRKGAAFLLFVVLFMIGSVLLTLIVSRGVYEGLVAQKILEESKISFYAADAAVEDAIYRHLSGMNYSASENFTFAGVPVVVTRTSTLDVLEFDVTANNNEKYRSAYAELQFGSGASFNFGLQSSTGGITMQNSASVIGNVYSNGPIEGTGSSLIAGDVISAGSSGLVEGVHATGSAWAHTIINSDIDRDAYYQTISSTIVGGTSFPGSPDQPISALPIDDAKIEEWKDIAELGGTLPLASCSGGTSAGTYTLSSDTTIGPLKIPCNLIISGNNTEVSLTGSLWVEGNISLTNGPTVEVDASLPGQSMYIIADKESDRLTSSKIISQGQTGYLGSSGTSYVLMVSMNESAENGGSETAIDVDNNTPSGEKDVIYYASHGQILARNSLKLRGATAFNITLRNSAIVEYETGMVSLLFSGGPGGSYVISEWRETE